MSSAERIASTQFSALGVVGPQQLPPEVVELLTLALRRGATDILLAVDRAPSLRVSAKLTPVEELPPPGADAIVRLAHTLLGERGIAELEQQQDRDFAFEVTGLARFRGSFYYQRGGAGHAVVRTGAAQRLPPEPRRRAGRRDARRRDDPDGAVPGGDGAFHARDLAHELVCKHDPPDHRRLP